MTGGSIDGSFESLVIFGFCFQPHGHVQEITIGRPLMQGASMSLSTWRPAAGFMMGHRAS